MNRAIPCVLMRAGTSRGPFFLRESTINVDVVNDIITLKGTVANAAQKASAEKVAKSIEGQKGVKNELKVAPNDSMTNTNTHSNSNSNANMNKNTMKK